METTAKFSINEIGEETGKHYSGDFTVKTILERGEYFEADKVRRSILGVNGGEALPSLQGEAYMLGEMSQRIVESPDWWKDSLNGMKFQDPGVIGLIFKKINDLEKERKAAIKKEAKKALKKMAEKSA